MKINILQIIVITFNKEVEANQIERITAKKIQIISKSKITHIRDVFKNAINMKEKGLRNYFE